MSVKAVREYHGKRMVFNNLGIGSEYKGVLVKARLGELDKLPEEHPWLLKEPLVVKPDQLIKRRGKAGLIKVNCSFEECKAWILEKCQKEQVY